MKITVKVHLPGILVANLFYKHIFSAESNSIF